MLGDGGGEDGVDHDLLAAGQQRVGQAVAGDFHVGLDARRGGASCDGVGGHCGVDRADCVGNHLRRQGVRTKQLGKRNEGVDLVVQHRGAHCEGVGAIYLVGDVLQRLTAFLDGKPLGAQLGGGLGGGIDGAFKILRAFHGGKLVLGGLGLAQRVARVTNGASHQVARTDVLGVALNKQRVGCRQRVAVSGLVFAHHRAGVVELVPSGPFVNAAVYNLLERSGQCVHQRVAGLWR